MSWRPAVSTVLALLLGAMSIACNGDGDEHAVGPRTVKRKVRLLVVSDGFTDEYKHEFTMQVANAEKAFFRLPGNDPQTVDLDIVKDYKSMATLGESRFGLKHTGLESDCYFKFGGAVKQLAALGAASGAKYTLLVFGASGGGGCAHNEVMFIVADTVVEDIVHEMGHAVGGLYDERGTKSGSSKANKANCSTNKITTPWAQALSTPAEAACDGYAALYHPTTKCLMISSYLYNDFCVVCNGLLKQVNERSLPAGPLAFTEREGLDVTAVVRTDGSMDVVSAIPATEERLAPPVINGDLFVAAFRQFGTSSERIVAVGPLALDDPEDEELPAGGRARLTARVYPTRGGEERRVLVDAIIARFTLYGVTRENAASQNLRMQIRKLEDPDRATLVNAQTRNAVAAPPLVQPTTFNLQAALMQHLNAD